MVQKVFFLINIKNNNKSPKKLKQQTAPLKNSEKIRSQRKTELTYRDNQTDSILTSLYSFNFLLCP